MHVRLGRILSFTPCNGDTLPGAFPPGAPGFGRAPLHAREHGNSYITNARPYETNIIPEPLIPMPLPKIVVNLSLQGQPVGRVSASGTSVMNQSGLRID